MSDPCQCLPALLISSPLFLASDSSIHLCLTYSQTLGACSSTLSHSSQHNVCINAHGSMARQQGSKSQTSSTSQTRIDLLPCCSIMRSHPAFPPSPRHRLPHAAENRFISLHTVGYRCVFFPVVQQLDASSNPCKEGAPWRRRRRRETRGDQGGEERKGRERRIRTSLTTCTRLRSLCDRASG